jgi:hypothetical protein
VDDKEQQAARAALVEALIYTGVSVAGMVATLLILRKLDSITSWWAGQRARRSQQRNVDGQRLASVRKDISDMEHERWGEMP